MMGSLPQRESSRRYRKNHPEETKEKRRLYQIKHREQIAEYQKRHRLELKEQVPLSLEDEALFEKWFVDAFEAQDIMLSRAQSLDLAP